MKRNRSIDITFHAVAVSGQFFTKRECVTFALRITQGNPLRFAVPIRAVNECARLTLQLVSQQHIEAVMQSNRSKHIASSSNAPEYTFDTDESLSRVIRDPMSVLLGRSTLSIANERTHTDPYNRFGRFLRAR